MLYYHLFQQYVSTPNSYPFIKLWKLICSVKVPSFIKFLWQKCHPALLFHPSLLLNLTRCAAPPYYSPPALLLGSLEYSKCQIIILLNTTAAIKLFILSIVFE